MGIATGLFPKVVQPGAAWAPLLSEIRDEVGLRPRVPVIVVASHDTASAVVAVPAQDNNFAYISSGTWSLVGLELTQPIITSEALESNFSNEGGFAGRTRFLRNVMGLWLLQQCRRVWNKGGRDYSYDDLARMGESSPAFGCVVDPDEPVFLAPGDIPARIRAFCVETNQPPPETPGAIVRCILESLALKYRWVIERAERLSGRRVDVIHVVGGGARNSALCQASADATGRRVLAGPVEATAIGNVMVQAYSQGKVTSLEDIRRVVAASTESRIYEPHPSRERWDSAYERLIEIMSTRGSATARAPREVPA
jgi:rhamnulokinase